MRTQIGIRAILAVKIKDQEKELNDGLELGHRTGKARVPDESNG